MGLGYFQAFPKMIFSKRQLRNNLSLHIISDLKSFDKSTNTYWTYHILVTQEKTKSR